MKTYFGKTAGLVQQAKSVSHFQRAVLRIGNFLILLTIGLVLVIGLAALFRQDPLLETLQFVLILTVTSIPVALPAVLSVTMAIGAERLAKFKAIVSRLVSIEEMAGMDMLCTDKTGTLTKNELTLGIPEPAAGVTTDELILAVVLATVEELRSVRRVQARRVEPAALAVQGRTVALQVAQVSVGRLAPAAAHLDHARLDHDAARAIAHAALRPAPAALAREGGDELAAPAARVEPARPRARSGAPGPSLADQARVAASAGDSAQDLLLEGSRRPTRAPFATGTRAAQARLEARIVVAGHVANIRARCREDKSLQDGT